MQSFPEVDLQFSQRWLCRVSLSGSAVDLLCICFSAILQMSRLWLAPIVVDMQSFPEWICNRSVVYMLSRYPSDECADCGALHWANLLVFPVVYMLSRYPSDECADCGALHWANLLVFRDNLQSFPEVDLQFRPPTRPLSGSAEFP